MYCSTLSQSRLYVNAAIKQNTAAKKKALLVATIAKTRPALLYFTILFVPILCKPNKYHRTNDSSQTVEYFSQSNHGGSAMWSVDINHHRAHGWSRQSQYNCQGTHKEGKKDAFNNGIGHFHVEENINERQNKQITETQTNWQIGATFGIPIIVTTYRLYSQSLNLAAITLPIPPPKPKNRMSQVVYTSSLPPIPTKSSENSHSICKIS